MLYHSVVCIRLEGQQVFRHGLAKCHASGASLEKVFCQRCVKEVRLVRYYVVEDGDDFAVLLHPACYIAKRRGEIRHPVSHNQYVRVPVADLSVCAAVRKRIGRIQQGFALHRYGLIVCCHMLGLSGKEELGILSLEVECLDNMLFAQFFEQTCVKLRDSSSVGIETGQYGYLQFSISLRS